MKTLMENDCPSPGIASIVAAGAILLFILFSALYMSFQAAPASPRPTAFQK